MQPTRAAWFFAAGFAWLVLRGILVFALPSIRMGQITQDGGLLLIIPLTSVVASVTAPLFFLSFLRHHPFEGQSGLRNATTLAAGASLLSWVLVLGSFVSMAGGPGPDVFPAGRATSWLVQVIPLFFVVSILVFMTVFARQCKCSVRLRRAAAIAAWGTSIPTLMITTWLFRSRVAGTFDWYPAFSQSLPAKVLGLAAAAALLWFLETFATTYDGDTESPDLG